MNVKNVMYLFTTGYTQEQIVKKLDLTEDDALQMASIINSWFNTLQLEADRLQRFRKRDY